MTTAMTTQSSGEHHFSLVSQLADADASVKDPACCGLRASTLVTGVGETRAQAEQPETDGAREHTEPTPCHMYPGLCTSIDGDGGDEVDENGHHFDHAGRVYSIPGLEIPDDPEIWAHFLHLSGSTPNIAFMDGGALTPDQARVKAQELRLLADDMDALADQVEVARALHNLRKARETADAGFAEVLTIMENAIVRDGADPVEVGERVLDLLHQAMTERAEATAQA